MKAVWGFVLGVVSSIQLAQVIFQKNTEFHAPVSCTLLLQLKKRRQSFPSSIRYLQHLDLLAYIGSMFVRPFRVGIFRNALLSSKRSFKCFTTSNITFTKRDNGEHKVTGMNVNNVSSIASQQRKKVLTFQKTAVPGVNTDIAAPGEAIIHPAFVTSSNLETFMEEPVKPVVSVTKCESYDLDNVRSILGGRGITPIEIVPGECVFFKWNLQDIFIFKFGTIVAWNVEEGEVIDQLVPIFSEAEITTYNYQSEDLDFFELSAGNSNQKSLTSGAAATTDNTNQAKNESWVSRETEIICLNVPTEQQKMLDMLAFSYGISRSTRLAILEEAVQTHINMTRDTIDKLSQGKKIAVDPKEALKLSGRLLLLRGKLNLYSELVETPDIYWSESRLEKIHDKISNALDITKRVNILNRKLDYLSEEAEALVGILSTRTEVNLELIIIYLIVIEVVFEVYHFYERLGGKYNIEYFRTLLE